MIKSINKTSALFLANILKRLNLKKYNNIWVIGGSVGKRYIDNGASFYEHVIKEYPEIKIFWLINRNSPDIAKIKGPFLYRNSLKGNLYVLLADVLVCTHELPYDVCEYSIDKFKKDSIKVSISHGIEGFKKKSPEQSKVHQLYDIAISVSDFEKNIKVKEWGLDESKVCISGMPRHDKIEKHRGEKREGVKNILYMPTWRPVARNLFLGRSLNEITKEEIENFKQSEYYKNINEFLSHPHLLKLLEESNIKLHLFFHPNSNEFMKKVVDIPNSPLINIFSIEDGVQSKIIESDLLITDYSSVCWDFLYLDKPIIFYQFDQKEYLRDFGSYIKIPDNLFGPATYNAKETISKIEDIVKGVDDSKDIREESRKKFFKYQDNKNSQRMIDCILKS